MKHIVKQQGHSEPYDERKLYASIYAACLSVNSTEGSAELIAAKVVEHVNGWLENKAEVTAHDIRRVATGHLKAYHQDAAYMYERHKELHL